MSEPRPSLSLKVEEFVYGIVRFSTLYVRTTFSATAMPRIFNIGIAKARRQRRIVHPLSFLIVGCFLFSAIIDTYPEGWSVYFNWIWLSDDISQKITERGGDLFSLTAVVRSGLPTFMCFVVLAQTLSILLARSRWIRPRVFATIIYAFGLHSASFAFACFLPIISSYALNPESSDSAISNLWEYGVAYLVIGLTVILAASAFISPILLIGWSAHRREARWAFKPVFARLGVAIPAFFVSIFIATEIGSLPARFTVAIKPVPKVEYQFLQGPTLHGSGPGDISGATYSVILYNRTEKLAYIDSMSTIAAVTITLPDGDVLSTKDNTQFDVFDETHVLKTILPLLPGKAQLVYFEVHWETIGTLGVPTSTSIDGSWSYDGLNVALDLNPVSGADIDGDMSFDLGNPSIRPW